jgi:sec-independent protein translocase protein TatA
MFGLGLPEITIIIVAIVVLFFGGKKITELARGLGRFAGEFKKGKMEIEKEIKNVEKEIKTTESGNNGEVGDSNEQK